ncbi:MAG: DNA adenine methylase [candidate division KSB1 bacterium]|nr:DNA adenine methylase [candidate division KSB1 bacterium]
MAEWATPSGVRPLPARRFLKWAGGKNRLLQQLEPFFPERIVHYHEPFLGSGAVFFHLRRTRGAFPATLMDSNAELINCFTIVRDRVDELLPLLRQHEREHSKRYYYATRGVIQRR